MILSFIIPLALAIGIGILSFILGFKVGDIYAVDKFSKRAAEIEKELFEWRELGVKRGYKK